MLYPVNIGRGSCGWDVMLDVLCGWLILTICSVPVVRMTIYEIHVCVYICMCVCGLYRARATICLPVSMTLPSITCPERTASKIQVTTDRQRPKHRAKVSERE